VRLLRACGSLFLSTNYNLKDCLGPSRLENLSSLTSHARETFTLAPSSRADQRAHAALTSASTRGSSAAAPPPFPESESESESESASGNARKSVQCAIVVCLDGAPGKFSRSAPRRDARHPSGSRKSSSSVPPCSGTSCAFEKPNIEKPGDHLIGSKG
jgi:hypothetical protein